MKKLGELVVDVINAATTLESIADQAVEIDDETEREAMSLTPWKLRRMALQLHEMASKVVARHAKLTEKTS